MDSYALSYDAPLAWDQVCEDESRLFHSLEWQRLLDKSFASRSVYAWDAAGCSGAAFTIFAAGPFRVGYLGFPVGTTIGRHPNFGALLDAWRHQHELHAPVCIRIPAGAFTNSPILKLPYLETPETAIIDLQSWDLSSTSSNVRRDLKKAERAGMDVVPATDDSAAGAMFRLYRATIERHQGSLRYSRSYFENLVRLSRTRSDLRVYVAKDGDEVVAFNVAAVDGKSGYYLHGGIEVAARDSRPGAPLMYEAIRWAQAADCDSFSMLSSPTEQDSLVRYKEKWGGVTRKHRTYTLALSPIYPIFRAAESLYKMLR